jgi:hypothetical protein
MFIHRNSSVSIVIARRRKGGRLQRGGIFLHYLVQIGSGAQPALSPVGHVRYFPGYKAAGG